jgi:hypothetical protein
MPINRQFISYPKSGRSWIRYILSQLGLDGEINFHHDGFEFNDGNKPQHCFDLEARRERYPQADKLVYLDRDPRDVMVSLYYQVTGRFKDFFNFPGSMSDFLRDDYFGAINLQRYRSMWEQLISERQFKHISYEDCHRDSLAVVKSVLDYYELPYDMAALQASVEKARFEEMQRLELSGQFPQPWLRLRNDAPKVRKGQVGDHLTVLAATDITYLNHVFQIS